MDLGSRGRTEGKVVELAEEEVEEWTDGSRIRGRAAAATRTSAKYLGRMTTIADAEAVGVSLAWETCDVVALDSKGVIQRIQGAEHQIPRSWIEERLARQMIERPRALMWVKDHDGVEGNEAADARAKKEVLMREMMLKPDIVTPAGLSATPQGTGPFELAPTGNTGLDILGNRQGPPEATAERDWKGGRCELRVRRMDPTERCPPVRMSVGGRRGGRSREQVRGDAQWCAAVARFMR